MSGKWLVPFFLALALASGFSVRAQTLRAGDHQPRSILERVDQFGQSLLRGMFGGERDPNTTSATAREPATYEPVPAWQSGVDVPVGTRSSQLPRSGVQPQGTGAPGLSGQSPTPRAGSILSGPARAPQGIVGADAAPAGNARPVPEYRSTARPDFQASPPKNPSDTNSSSPRGGSRTAVLASSPETVGAFNPAQRPLHRRLSILRDSAFGPGEKPVASEQDPPAKGQTLSQAAAATDPPAASRDGGLIVAQPAEADLSRSPDTGRDVPTPAARPAVAEPTPAADPPLSQTTPTPASREPRPATGPGEGMLLAQKGPVLSVETFGPRTISIGREASYQVDIQNAGEVGVDELVVYIQLPPWADVSAADASMGATQLPVADAHEGAFVWKVGHLAAKSSERLTLKLVPRQSRPFDLSVRWEYQPLRQQALIEVQEPKVEIQLEGPREVQYGHRETYRLRMKNTGNGPAENVVITLLPVGKGGSQPVSHRLGVIEVGEEKALEVEITARQAGSITIGVEVHGEAGVQAELAETILVRRAELQLAAGAPKMRFVGSEVTYDLRVANLGNAPARNIQLSADLPEGAKYVSGIDGGRLDAGGSGVTWIVPKMEAGAEETYQVRASLGRPGSNRLEFLATADDALNASAEAFTRVDAMADLTMEVQDPPSPVPVGSDTVYRLLVRNRGTEAAENVEIVAYFSRGIEPVSAEGGAHRIGPGQVVFSPIPSLMPGAEVVFTIRAQAEQPGNHIFRAEMHCKPLDARLVREETTHFYQDGSVAAAVPEAEAVDTADRRSATGEATRPEGSAPAGSEPRR